MYQQVIETTNVKNLSVKTIFSKLLEVISDKEVGTAVSILDKVTRRRAKCEVTLGLMLYRIGMLLLRMTIPSFAI